MIKKSTFITAAMLIIASLPAARAAVILPGNITVAELAKEMLAKKTLKQVQASAAAVADEAGQLRMMANSEASPESYLGELTALKVAVNRMGQEISRLNTKGASLAPWEQQAVDKVLPLYQAAAANAESAIDYFNENRDHLWTKAYGEYAGRVSQDSEEIAKILKNYLKYDKLRDRDIQAEERVWLDSGE